MVDILDLMLINIKFRDEDVKQKAIPLGNKNGAVHIKQILKRHGLAKPSSLRTIANPR